MGAVTALLHVPVPTASVLFNIVSRVVSTLIVDGESERGFSSSRRWLLMN